MYVAARGRARRAQVLVEMRGKRRHIALLANGVTVHPSGGGRVGAAARACLGHRGHTGRHQLTLPLLRLLDMRAEWNAPGPELSGVGG